eukprot:8472161-Prorocentrum_lima.AAC.1
MRLSRSLKEIGYQQGITDKHIWRKFDKNAKPVTDKHCGYSPQLISFISTHICVEPQMLNETFSSQH